MNDKRLTYSRLLALPVLSMLLLTSCSQEAMDVRGGTEDDDIIFHVALPGVETGTRSYDNIQVGNLYGGFSVTAMNLDSLINKDETKMTPAYYLKSYNKIDLYFKDKLVERTPGTGDAFRGDGCRWPQAKDGKDGLVQFFAFYPAVETLKSKLVIPPGDKTDYFLVHHGTGNDQSEKRDTGYWFNYRMGNFYINQDISTHSDFVSASVRGSKTDNLYSGVKLQFEHKLCRVDLKAWNANKGYDIEIAGVRIGGVIRKSTYNLAGNWISNGATWGFVDYIFNEGNESREADQVFRIGYGSYDTSAKATSIMGKGGYALLIPHRPSNLGTTYPYKWNYTGNPTNTNNGMYFSVLIRVIDKTDNQGLILYPYKDGATITGNTTASNKNSVYLVVEKTTETVRGRVYKNKSTKQYFSDSDLKTPFTAGDGLEIREYAWAAIPYVQTWYIGRTYTYVLDYTNGVGLHAPDDDAPGKPIITPYAVNVSEDEKDWKMVIDYDTDEIEISKDQYTQE